MQVQSPQQLLNQAELIHSSQAVNAAINRLSQEITLVLADTCPVVICVMSGGLVFAGQLLARLNFPLQVDYVHASRYQHNTVGKTLTWQALPKLELTDRTVLLLDDILDEGITLLAIKEKWVLKCLIAMCLVVVWMRMVGGVIYRRFMRLSNRQRMLKFNHVF
jgi:hypoxanthine phosphoribosyltransferase